MEQVLLVVQVLIAVALIGMVLLQRSESDGFGLSGGSGNNLLSGRGTANLMTRTTAILAGLFIINSLALSILAAHGRAPSIVESIEQQQAESLKTDGSPAVPVEGQDTKATPKANADAKKPAEKVAAPAVPTEGEEKPVVKKAAKKVAPKAEETPAETDNE